MARKYFPEIKTSKENDSTTLELLELVAANFILNRSSGIRKIRIKYKNISGRLIKAI